MPRDYLKKLRKKKKMSMQNVADKIGISRQYYQQIEAGKKQKKMDATLIVLLANIFCVTTEQIIKHEKLLLKKGGKLK